MRVVYKKYLDKGKERLNKYLINMTRETRFYPFLYRSYWHSLYAAPNNRQNDNYLAARPNPGAGIGHQLANWTAGLWFSKQFGLQFAHIPFSNNAWEALLGFGEFNKHMDSLVKDQGYKVVKLPLFEEDDIHEVENVKKIIDSYANSKIVFILEQDQFYRDQYGISVALKQFFYNAEARKSEHLFYSSDFYNIALHVRRGDIEIGQIDQNQNLLMRWQENDYYYNVLQNIFKTISIEKPIKVYLFSQGRIEDYPEFKDMENIEFCLDVNAYDSFLHMVYADILVTSKSSFSYKPALLSNGIKICPKNFWHSYPDEKKWILADEKGSFDTNQLRDCFEK